MQGKIRKFKFQKLVRDRIVPGIIVDGGKPVFRKLARDEFIKELEKKLLEEGQELSDAKSNKKKIEEIADIKEIIDFLLDALGATKSDIIKSKKRKNKERGSFKKRHYIEYVEVEEGSSWIDYYLKNPDKYPEIKK